MNSEVRKHKRVLDLIRMTEGHYNPDCFQRHDFVLETLYSSNRVVLMQAKGE